MPADNNKFINKESSLAIMQTVTGSYMAQKSLTRSLMLVIGLKV